MGAALIFFSLQYIIEPKLYFRYNPIGAFVANILIVFYSLLYFFKQLSEKGPFLIVNAGIFFYMLSSILVFATGNLVFNEKYSATIPKLMREINTVLYLTFQILILIEWWKNYATPYKKLG